MDPDLPVFKKYVVGPAATAWRGSVESLKKEGHSITGDSAYYNHKVVGVKGNRATVTYCEDQSHGYRKDAKTGKTIKTQPSKDDFIGHADTLQKGDDGIWRMIDQFNEEGASSCQR